MDENTFWNLIDRVRTSAPGDQETQRKNLASALKALNKDDCRSAATFFEQSVIKAYNWRLWGAAYIINGGCSDDSFMDFRSSLVLLGRDVFDAAIADPDSLALVDQDEEAWTFEGFQYAVSEALEAVCGRSAQDDLPEHPADPAGKEWDEDDLPSLFPRLSAKYNDGIEAPPEPIFPE